MGAGLPLSWLGILADVAPSTDELIYAWHPDGFAMHSMRSATVSRLYLQVPNGTDPEDWSDDRIWDALATRLGHGQDGWRLAARLPTRACCRCGPSSSPRCATGGCPPGTPRTPSRPPAPRNSTSQSPTSHCSLPALGRLIRANNLALVDAYSATALRRVWRYQHFAWWMTSMLHTSGDPFDASSSCHSCGGWPQAPPGPPGSRRTTPDFPLDSGSDSRTSQDP